MDSPQTGLAVVRSLLLRSTVATLAELKAALGTDTRMTVFRSLRRAGYLSSYSHRGAYYALAETPEFDDVGLWRWEDVRFSRFGSLLSTVEALVGQSSAGFAASELDDLLGVETKHAALKLTRDGRIARGRPGGRYVYLSAEPGRRRQQELMRQDLRGAAEVGMGLGAALLADEMRAAIILFFSLLDEGQRRLYAGLEAAKLGHGGDQRIAELLGLDPHTVAKGRREILGGSVQRGRIRGAGGGDIPVEKKARR